MSTGPRADVALWVLERSVVPLRCFSLDRALTASGERSPLVRQVRVVHAADFVVLFSPRWTQTKGNINKVIYWSKFLNGDQ